MRFKKITIMGDKTPTADDFNRLQQNIADAIEAPLTDAKAAPTWHPLTLSNGWKAVAGFAVPSASIDQNGWVSFQGRVAGGAQATVGFTMPSGMCPGAVTDTSALSGTVPYATHVQVRVFNGSGPIARQVFLALAPVTGWTTGNWVSLDSIPSFQGGN